VHSVVSSEELPPARVVPSPEGGGRLADLRRLPPCSNPSCAVHAWGFAGPQVLGANLAFLVTSATSLDADEVKRAVRASPSPLALVDGSGILVAANAAMAGLVGVDDPDRVVGEPVWRFAVDVEQARHHMRDISEGVIDSFTAPGQLRRVDGELIGACVWSRRVPVRDGALVAIGVAEPGGVAAPPVPPAGSARPTHLAVLTTDRDWRIVDASRDAERLLAASPRQLAGTPLLGMIHPLDAGNAVVALAHLARDHDAVALDVRVRAGSAWRRVHMTVARLDDEAPPRLVVLLSAPSEPHEATGGAPNAKEGERPSAALAVPHGGEFLPDLARAALQRAVELHELTGRQWEIVARLMRSQSIGEIAASMYLSEGTVRNQLTRIYRTFGVHSQAGLLSAIYAGQTDRQ
jgi:PAS domain-containing protein/DNA-binding CsgD family transcriptional regulator